MLPELEPPPGYEYAMTSEELALKWPKLHLKNNFHFTSLKRRGYNCIAYALGEVNKDLDMFVFAKKFGLDKNTLNHSATGYAKIFQNYYGFMECAGHEFEPGFTKIAMYENAEGDFTHIALQLEDGTWTSKMGVYEDIQHYDLSAISGDFYGIEKLCLKRPVEKQITHFI